MGYLIDWHTNIWLFKPLYKWPEIAIQQSVILSKFELGVEFMSYDFMSYVIIFQVHVL